MLWLLGQTEYQFGKICNSLFINQLRTQFRDRLEAGRKDLAHLGRFAGQLVSMLRGAG
jgi:hypothetical protein